MQEQKEKENCKCLKKNMAKEKETPYRFLNFVAEKVRLYKWTKAQVEGEKLTPWKLVVPSFQKSRAPKKLQSEYAGKISSES